MISIPDKVPRKKRIVLGPLSRKLLQLSKWDITGEFPNYKKIILIGAPHTANRDAWYALLAILALDLKINFFGSDPEGVLWSSLTPIANYSGCSAVAWYAV